MGSNKLNTHFIILRRRYLEVLYIQEDKDAMAITVVQGAMFGVTPLPIPMSAENRKIRGWFSALIEAGAEQP